MNIMRIEPQNPDRNKIEKLIEILKNGGVILYPTDTVYGIGANIFDENAVKKVYSIKKRSYAKPLSVCVSNIDEIEKIAYLNSNLRKFISKIFPGPFTVILEKKENVPDIITAGSKKIGVRIPDSTLCMELSKEFPITTTSANISGEKILESADHILRELGDVFDAIIDASSVKNIKPSTVVDLTGPKPKILRKGSEMPFQ
ncbi:MAG: L-threonylcarbamoyladenylate synthase [Methanobacteriaceae archaeon]|nr:L-threonylcarbamoyladenylate synthase [Methanobacteriaceae archaeon]